MFENYSGIVILGPTACGKTRLGIALARRFQGEIISCDALQVYKHMDIGTAKATASEREAVRHYMLDVRDPDMDFSAGDYQRLAREALSEIRSRSRVPFIVGGTGFYLRALLEGLFKGPARSHELRARMRTVIDRKGVECLHRALQRSDPISAARISRLDAARIIRAYEVYLVSGKPMSWWQSQARDALCGYRWLKLGINLPRDILYQKIDARVEEMFSRGLLEEVRGLLERYPRDCHAFKAIGYRQVMEYLDGRRSYRDILGEIKRDSRRYAKRQLTWFRSDPSIVWLNGQIDFNELIEQSEKGIAAFLEMG